MDGMVLAGGEGAGAVYHCGECERRRARQKSDRGLRRVSLSVRELRRAGDWSLTVFRLVVIRFASVDVTDSRSVMTTGPPQGALSVELPTIRKAPSGLAISEPAHIIQTVQPLRVPARKVVAFIASRNWLT